MKTIEDFIIREGRYKGKLDQKALQTGEAKGTFRLGQSHPVVKDLFYYKWWRSREYWVTKKSLRKYIKQRTRWQKKNRERCKRMSLEWNYRNKERAKLTSSNWKKRNKELVASYSSKRRAKSSTNLTEFQETIIKHFYSHSVRVSEKLKIIFEVDHIIPISKGGLHHPCNLQIVPRTWNRTKGAKNCNRWLPNGF